MIKIDKGFPIPIKESSKYPFKDMECGDSFFIDTTEETKRVSLTAIANRWAKANNNGVKFKTAKVDGGFRIWRVK